MGCPEKVWLALVESRMFGSRVIYERYRLVVTYEAALIGEMLRLDEAQLP
jgi:hypothetical protein